MFVLPSLVYENMIRIAVVDLISLQYEPLTLEKGGGLRGVVKL
jgi:hypothetical protein